MTKFACNSIKDVLYIDSNLAIGCIFENGSADGKRGPGMVLGSLLILKANRKMNKPLLSKGLDWRIFEVVEGEKKFNPGYCGCHWKLKVIRSYNEKYCSCDIPRLKKIVEWLSYNNHNIDESNYKETNT